MPSIKDLFPDKWLRPEHLRGRAVTVAVQGAQVEQLFNPRSRRNEPKLVLEFHGKQLRLPLNKTQAHAMAAITKTDDYTQWKGHQCVLSPGIAPNQQPTIQIAPVPEKPPTVSGKGKQAKQAAPDPDGDTNAGVTDAADDEHDDDHHAQMEEDAAAEARAAAVLDG